MLRDCLGRELANVVRLLTSLGTLVCFSLILVPTHTIIAGSNSKYSELGKSILLAGYAVPFNQNEESSQVYWLWMNTHGICTNGTELHDLWAEPNSLCRNCSETSECFDLPSEAYYQFAVTIACVVMASVLSLFRALNMLCCGCTYSKDLPFPHSFKLTQIKKACGCFDAILSLMLMLGTGTVLVSWTLHFTGNETRIPIYNNTLLVVSDPVVMEYTRLYSAIVVGFCLSVIGVAFICVDDCSTCRKRQGSSVCCCGPISPKLTAYSSARFEQ